MKVVYIAEKNIEGLSVRTKNADEINPEKAKIAALHQQFDKICQVDYAKGYRVYGLYYDYESDATGEFSVLAGTDQIAHEKIESMKSIQIPAGKYCLFDVSGDVPQVVIKAWAEIWIFFEKNTDYQRNYVTDFEYYKSQTEVEVYIGIK